MAKYRIVKSYSVSSDRYWYNVEQKKFLTGWWYVGGDSTEEGAKAVIERHKVTPKKNQVIYEE